MPYKDNLIKASNLKKELDSYRPLSPEMEGRIMQKFRLDWNYHSSHIEGNLLTYGETKALILFGQTAQAKPLKDHIEMTGHNEAIKYIEEVIHLERPLTEAFIRELHTLILKEPYEVDAITPDGKPTKRTISVGKYKTVPNHVKTQTGEIFYFSTPEETPAKMDDLLKWYKENFSNPEMHPVLFATEFHYRFICIHPFDDGNGRIARLLMNFILMQKGYPPAIIKTEEKDQYFAALRQADVGQLEFFFNYVCTQVIHSIELMIKGAKGESIEEDDDLDKKLALLTQEIEAEDSENEIKTRLSSNIIKKILDEWGYKLLNLLAETTGKFNKFYDKPEHGFNITIDRVGQHVEFTNEISFEKLILIFANTASEPNPREASIRITTSFGGYKKGGTNPFGCNYTFEIKFDQYSYQVFIGYFSEDGKGQQTRSFTKKLLHKPITNEEIKEINKLWGDTLFAHLEYGRNKLKKNGIG